jgi:hypothetical protein
VCPEDGERGATQDAGTSEGREVGQECGQGNATMRVLDEGELADATEDLRVRRSTSKKIK